MLYWWKQGQAVRNSGSTVISGTARNINRRHHMRYSEKNNSHCDHIPVAAVFFVRGSVIQQGNTHVINFKPYTDEEAAQINLYKIKIINSICKDINNFQENIEDIIDGFIEDILDGFCENNDKVNLLNRLKPILLVIYTNIKKLLDKNYPANKVNLLNRLKPILLVIYTNIKKLLDKNYTANKGGSKRQTERAIALVMDIMAD